MSRHVLVFIHGIGDASSDDDYGQLASRLRREHDAREGHGRFERRFVVSPVHWQQETTRAQDALFRDAYGTAPVRLQSLGGGIANLLDGVRLLRHPTLALRSFMTSFLGDAIAYVSRYDNRIRRSVWEQLSAAVPDGHPFSLVGHSLGGVIAFDFLYHLYKPGHAEGGELFPPLANEPARVAALQRQFRGLYTLGAPVGLFTLRNGALWQAGDRPFSRIRNPLSGTDHTWLNFWASQDIIASPLQALFARNRGNASRPLVDVKVRTGLDPVSAHIGYWRSEAVVRRMTQTLRATRGRD